MRALAWTLLTLLCATTAHAQQFGPPQDSTASFTCTAPCTTPTIATSGYAQVTVVATGTGGSLAFTFQGSNDNGVTWVTLPAVTPSAPTAFVTSGSANGAWLVPSAGWQRIRVNVSGLATGTETFALAASIGTNIAMGSTPTPVQANLLGDPNVTIATPADVTTGYVLATTGASSAGDSGSIGAVTGDALGGESGALVYGTGTSDIQSGGVVFTSGDAPATGSVRFRSGAASAGLSGEIEGITGDAVGGQSGPIGFGTGTSDTASGAMYLNTGDAPETGGIESQTGYSSAGASGKFAGLTGNALGGASGPIQLITGTSDTNSGDIIISTGGAPLVGSITLTLGAGATPGNLVLSNIPTVAPAVTGAVWADPITHILMVVP